MRTNPVRIAREAYAYSQRVRCGPRWWEAALQSWPSLHPAQRALLAIDFARGAQRGGLVGGLMSLRAVSHVYRTAIRALWHGQPFYDAKAGIAAVQELDAPLTAAYVGADEN